MQVFLNFFERSPLLSTQTHDAIIQSFKVEFYKRGDLLRREGELCDKIYFIRKGLVHIYKQKSNKKKTEWISAENQMICPFNRFIKQEQSSVIYEALEPTEVHTVNFSAYNLLCQYSDFRDLINSIVIEKIYEVNGFLIGNTGDAANRYKKFTHHFPNIVNRVPVNIIASFLDVCPKTISRIRATKKSVGNKPNSLIRLSDKNLPASE